MAEAIVSALCFLIMFSLTLYARHRRKKKLEPKLKHQKKELAEIKARGRWS